MANFDKSTFSPITDGDTIRVIETPPAVSQEALLMSILVQQSDNHDLLVSINNRLDLLHQRLLTVEGHLGDIRHDLTETTIADKDGVRGVDRHTESFYAAPNDPRNPETLKDFLALIKTEVRHSDDCGFDRLCRDKPWALLLVVEQFGKDDLDGNGLVFGYHFIFSDPYESWPPVLQDAIGEDDYAGWSGIKLSFVEYRNGLPAESAFRAHLSDWISLVG